MVGLPQKTLKVVPPPLVLAAVPDAPPVLEEAGATVEYTCGHCGAALSGWTKANPTFLWSTALHVTPITPRPPDRRHAVLGRRLFPGRETSMQSGRRAAPGCGPRATTATSNARHTAYEPTPEAAMAAFAKPGRSPTTGLTHAPFQPKSVKSFRGGASC